MPENKKNMNIYDRLRVDAKDPSEVEYFREKFPSLSHAVIRQAIIEAGPFRKDIKKLLEQQPEPKP
ncbi:hypothetical protein BH11BAC4_BH11BAC4_06690 [soil metagenome]